MENKRDKFVNFLVIALFAVSPFVMPFKNEEMMERVPANMLPAFVVSSAGYVRWALLILMTLVSFTYLRGSKKIKISKPALFLFLFYFIMFLVALVDGIDIVRFGAVAVFSLLLPPLIGFGISQNPRVIKYFCYLILMFLVVSILLNGHLVLMGYRFFGFMNNPNAYGVSAVFWLLIVLYADKKKMIGVKLFGLLLFLLFFTIVFSGSRNALAGMFLLFAINYYNQLKKFAFGVVFLLLALIVVSNFIDMSFVLGRFDNIADSASDSGRAEVWQRAYPAISQNLWWGNGMDANERIADTGNMHNCYIRFVLNMGLFFTILSFSMYVISIIIAYVKRKQVPLHFTAYLIIYAVMNIGEDFFVGVGSTAFLNMIFAYSFINYYITSSHASPRQSIHQ